MMLSLVIVEINRMVVPSMDADDYTTDNSRPSIKSLSSPRRPVRRQLIHGKSIAESNQDFKELALPERCGFPGLAK